MNKGIYEGEQVTIIHKHNADYSVDPFAAKKESVNMLEDEFKLYHEKGKLYAVITIKGETYEMDVTEYFDNNNPHDDWLDFRLNLTK